MSAVEASSRGTGVVVQELVYQTVRESNLTRCEVRTATIARTEECSTQSLIIQWKKEGKMEWYSQVDVC